MGGWVSPQWEPLPLEGLLGLALGVAPFLALKAPETKFGAFLGPKSAGCWVLGAAAIPLLEQGAKGVGEFADGPPPQGH